MEATMLFPKLKHHLLTELDLSKRLQNVVLWYLLFLMTSKRKHSLKEAAAFSGLHASQFSRVLKNHPHVPVECLKQLGKKRARELAKMAENLSNGKLPWFAAIIIDSTMQHRSSSVHPENTARINHGKGVRIGHQWTNVVLMINNKLVPLPPITFETKAYCRKHGLIYETENQKVTRYLLHLDLESYIGPHDPRSVVVLADSGYDDRKIQNVVRERGWDFIQALKTKRSVKNKTEYYCSPKSKGWHQVADFFKRNRRVKWQTIRIATNRAKKKRMELRSRQIKAALRYVGMVQLICSEIRNRPDGRRKYLACSNLKVTGRQIILGYRLRWAIEIFHKQVKMFLGFEDVAAHHFTAVYAHVHWVYCAYLLIHDEIKGLLEGLDSLAERQARMKQLIDSRQISRAVQTLTQFSGTQRYKNQLQQVLLDLQSGNVLNGAALRLMP